MRAEMQNVLENNILRFWLDKMLDTEHGGFYGQMMGSGQLVKTADKGAILSARILWSFAAAYRVLRKPEYLDAATRMKDYILEHLHEEAVLRHRLYDIWAERICPCNWRP